MIIQFEINGIASEFGAMPEGSINVIQIRTSGIPILIPSGQVAYAKTYLKNLVNNMSEDAFILFNGILIPKEDINLDI